MQIIITAKNIELNQDIKDLAEKKLAALAKFLKFSEDAEGKNLGDIFLEIGQETKHHRTGPFMKAEANIMMPGKNIMAEATSTTLKSALTILKNELQRELKAYSAKKEAISKRTGRQDKKRMHLAPEAKMEMDEGGRVREEGI